MPLLPENPLCSFILSPDEIHAGVLLRSFFIRPLIDPADLRILLCHALHLSHAQLIAHSDRQLNETEAAVISDMIRRRKKGEPVAYIIGSREFYGLSFIVSEDVLIPRPETELVVEMALSFLPEKATMLDLGTGSGAIAVSVAKKRKDVFVAASDISVKALAIAKLNANRHLENQKNIDFYQGSWFEALPASLAFDLIVSNPPYIANDDPHLLTGDLRYEPALALTDFHDGLSAYREITAGAVKWLKKGGKLIVEHGYNQAEAIRELFFQQGFLSIESHPDLAGIDRVTAGIFPG